MSRSTFIALAALGMSSQLSLATHMSAAIRKFLFIKSRVKSILTLAHGWVGDIYGCKGAAVDVFCSIFGYIFRFSPMIGKDDADLEAVNIQVAAVVDIIFVPHESLEIFLVWECHEIH